MPSVTLWLGGMGNEVGWALTSAMRMGLPFLPRDRRRVGTATAAAARSEAGVDATARPGAAQRQRWGRRGGRSPPAPPRPPGAHGSTANLRPGPAGAAGVRDG